MERLALGLSLLAVGLSGWTVWRSSEAPASDGDVVASLEARVASIERERAAAATAAARPTEAAPTPAAMTLAPASAAPVGSTASPTAVEDLERRVESLEATARAALGLAEDAPLGADAGARAAGGRSVALPSMSARMPRIYASIEDAAKDLGLTDGQRADFDRAIADARRELDDLKKIPDADGVTWEQVQKEAFRTEGGVFHLDMSKMEAFREKTVPGRSESYGAADRRVRDLAKRRMRDSLSPEQRDTFDKAMVDPLLGSPMGTGFAISASRIELTTDGD
jgi:hypothetical protein